MQKHAHIIIVERILDKKIAVGSLLQKKLSLLTDVYLWWKLNKECGILFYFTFIWIIQCSKCHDWKEFANLDTLGRKLHKFYHARAHRLLLK